MNAIFKTRRRFLHLTASCGILAPFFDQLQSLAATDAAQKRAVFVFFPHGTPKTSGFWPGEGPLANLTGVLAPLAQHQSRMLIVGGLGSGLEKGYGHSGANTAALTGRGTSDKDGGFYIPKCASADWQIARHLQQEPLVLGQNVASGARLLVSWSDPSRAGAVAPVNDVGEAFKRVFGRSASPGTCTAGGGLSAPPATQPASGGSDHVLDVVAADLKALKSEIPSWSRAALDDQLDAISELQVKAKAAAAMTPVKSPTPAVPTGSNGGGTSEGCYAAGTTDFYQRSNDMADLIVAALQGGTRRVVTFQQGTASGDSFSVPGYGGYHSEVHDLNSGEVKDAGRVTAMQTEIFKDIAYLMDRLTAVKDMSGETLISNTVVYLCTEFSPYGPTDDPHNTGGGLVVNLMGAPAAFDTSGKAITGKGSVGNVLASVAQYMGLTLGTGLTADDLGKFPPLAGVLRG